MSNNKNTGFVSNNKKPGFMSNKFSIKRTFVMFVICLFAAVTLSTFAHEFTHVAQIGIDDAVEPVSICLDYGQDSAAHVDYQWAPTADAVDKESFTQQNESREFVAYSIGFLTLGLFMGVTKLEHYW